MTDHCTILGVPLRVVSQAEVLDRVRRWLAAPEAYHYITTPNPEFMVRAARQPAFRRWLIGADLRLPDGMGLILVARWLYHVCLTRVTGSDLLVPLLTQLGEGRRRVHILGLRHPTTLARLPDLLRERFPGLNLTGVEPGLPPASHFTARPDVVFVAAGAPEQERWLAEEGPHVPGLRCALGVGGAFDYLTGAVPRAPQFVRRVGMEWFMRFLRQPRRLGRILTATVVFPALAVAERLMRLPGSSPVR